MVTEKELLEAYQVVSKINDEIYNHTKNEELFLLLVACEYELHISFMHPEWIIYSSEMDCRDTDDQTGEFKEPLYDYVKSILIGKVIQVSRLTSLK